MARLILLLLSILVFGKVTAFPQTAVKHYGDSWSASFEDYRKHIKSLTPAAKASCEKLLREILTDLDTKNQCSLDSHCSLIDQDPFGATIPIRTAEAHNVQKKMKTFRNACDDGSAHSVRDDEIENLPVCWKNKCMVKTRFKKK